MKEIKIYRDKQNNKHYVGERIRVINSNNLSFKDVTIYFKDESTADKVELLLYKLLNLSKNR